MTDRDRLAADLLRPEDAPQPSGRITRKWWRLGWLSANACNTDRLIALGWTRPREPGVYPTPSGIDVVVDVAESASWVEDEFPDEVEYLIAHAPLDEDRLDDVRRAITLSGDEVICHHASLAEHDAAIAKAYREDTDAHD